MHQVEEDADLGPEGNGLYHHSSSHSPPLAPEHAVWGVAEPRPRAQSFAPIYAAKAPNCYRNRIPQQPACNASGGSELTNHTIFSTHSPTKDY